MATISYVVNAVDRASATFTRIAGSADEVNAKLDELSRKNAQARVGLQGDREAELAIDKIDFKMANLARKVAEGKIGVEGQARALLEIRRLDVALDKLGAKHVTATVDVDVNRGGLRGLLSSIGGGGGLGSLLGGGIAGGVIAGAGLAPGVIGLGLGGLAGAGAFGGGLFGAAQGQKVIKADQANIKMITAALKTAVGKQKAELHQSLVEANKQFTKDMTFFAPFLAFQGALKGLGKIILAPLRPVMEPLTKIVQNFGNVLKTLGPQLTLLFKASLPFMRQFAGVLLKTGDILIPAFTDALNQMVKSGALKIMTDSLVVLVRGLGQFIEALGPGMKASAEMFSRLMTFIARALPVVGKIFSAVANFIIHFWSPSQLWDHIVGWAKTAWHALTDAAKTFAHANVMLFGAFRHDIAHIFDVIRHDIATIWDTIWRNTVTRARHAINDVIGWFKTLPGRAISALEGLGTMLWNFAHMAFTKFWNGLKSVAGGIVSWLKGFAGGIVQVFKNAWNWFSPSGVMYEAGRDLMLGLFHGIRDHAHKVQQAWGGAINFGGLTGALGGGAAANRRLAMRMFPWPMSMFGAFNALEMSEAGYSLTATNPSSGAYGMAQFINGPGEYYQYGGNPYTAGGQLAGMFNYIRQRFGNPAAAWAFHLQHGWYDRGGWLMPGTTVAVNQTGQPEQVVSGASMDTVVAELRAVKAELRQLNRTGPARTGAAVGDTINGTARRVALGR